MGQICHIEAANAGGQRFNPNSNDEERRGYDNLLLLCYRHHKETDDISDYDTKVLRDMKYQHESRHGEKPFKVNESFLHRLETEMQSYWDEIKVANTQLHVVPNLAIRLNIEVPAIHQFIELYTAVERLSELLGYLAERDESLNEEIRRHLNSLEYDTANFDNVPYYKNPFFNRNWETHALAANNALADLVVALKQTEVRFFEEHMKTHPNESKVLTALNMAKEELRVMAISAGYAD